MTPARRRIGDALVAAIVLVACRARCTAAARTRSPRACVERRPDRRGRRGQGRRGERRHRDGRQARARDGLAERRALDRRRRAAAAARHERRDPRHLARRLGEPLRGARPRAGVAAADRATAGGSRATTRRRRSTSTRSSTRSTSRLATGLRHARPRRRPAVRGRAQRGSAHAPIRSAPALTSTTAVLRELAARPRRRSSRLLVRGAATAARRRRAGGPTLDGADRVGEHHRAGDRRRERRAGRSLELLPGTLRQANTTFVGLRSTLDDLDPLVAAGAAGHARPRAVPAAAAAAGWPTPSPRSTTSCRWLDAPGPRNDLIDARRADCRGWSSRPRRRRRARSARWTAPSRAVDDAARLHARHRRRRPRAQAGPPRTTTPTATTCACSRACSRSATTRASNRLVPRPDSERLTGLELGRRRALPRRRDAAAARRLGTASGRRLLHRDHPAGPMRRLLLVRRRARRRSPCCSARARATAATRRLGYRVAAIFDNAAAAAEGEDVKVAGAKVGSDRVARRDARTARRAITIEITRRALRAVPSRRALHAAAGGRARGQVRRVRPGRAGEPELAQIDRGDGAATICCRSSGRARRSTSTWSATSMRRPTGQQLAILLSEFGTGLAGRGPELQRRHPPRQPGAGRDRPRASRCSRARPDALEQFAEDADRVLTPLARDRRVDRRLRRRTRTRPRGRRRRESPTSRALDRATAGASCAPCAPRCPTMLGALTDEGVPVLDDLERRRPGLSRADRAARAVRARRHAGDPVRSVTPPSARPRRCSGRCRCIRDWATSARSPGPAAPTLDDAHDELRQGARASSGSSRPSSTAPTAVNGFDDVGHYARAEPLSGACSEYTAKGFFGCDAQWGPTASAAGRSPSARGDQPRTTYLLDYLLAP